MVFRKPYAFLIKNFKKIHILLLLLTIYIYFKHTRLYSFVKDYVGFQSYNASLESIDQYTGVLPFLVLFIIILITGLLIYLLLYKKKPWKLYLVIILTYILMLVGFLMANSYFHNYDANSTIASAMAIRDILFIASLPQYAAFVILIIRITGIDLSKFDFAHDEEFMDLSENDREEFEINIDVDKESFKRGFKRFKRNFNYFYQEHKFLVNLGISIFVIILGITAYYNIFVLNKTYRQGETFNTLGYSIKINRAYFTNLNYKGEIVAKNSNFVILDINIKNNGASRTTNVERFHIVNKNSDIVSTKYYNKEFRDLGTPYETFELKRDAEKRFLLIYKVPKKLDRDNFSMYYQTITDDNNSKLIKIKLSLEDLTNVKTIAKAKLGEEMKMEQVKGTKEELLVNDYSFEDDTLYNYYYCNSDGACNIKSESINASSGNKILKIELISSNLDNEELVDFSLMYGKIKYEDSKGSTSTIELKNKIDREYLGNTLYLEVPGAVSSSKKLDLIYTLRNKRYIFNLK